MRASLGADVREGLASGAAVVLLGHVVRLVLGLAASAFVARALGPGDYGAYAVAGAAIAVGSTFADFGLSKSATRQIAGDLARDRERAYASGAAFVRHRLVGALVVLGAALALAEPLASVLGLPDGQGPELVRLAGATIFAAAANGAVSTIHHSLRRYRSLVVGQGLSSAATLAMLAALFLADRLTVTSAVAVGVAGNLASLAIGLALLPDPWRAALRRPAPLRGTESRRLRSFAGWLGAAAVFSIFISQLDLLLVSGFLDASEVGLYGLALALAFKADIVNQVLHTTLLPAVSGLSNRAEYAAYVRRSLIRSGVLAVPLLIALPLAGPFITAVYGADFEDATPIFYALMAIVLFDLVTHSALLLTFPLNMPRWIAGSDAAGAVTLAIAGVALIPAFGVYGAAAAKLLAKVVSALVVGWGLALQARGPGLRVRARGTTTTP